ncbi:hypothetical protein [Haloarcula montana]|uniref:hypothetical protein n=1 Tax=Haloarcula montana TaxID=3111776 RepID=UPI002D79B3B1|nr:hypothetical protein [Haloarcula sp. GH36]
MEWTTPRRVVAIVLLVGLVFGMGLHAGMDRPQSEQHWPYPRGDDIAADYEQFVGEKTLLWGTVRTVDPADGTAVIRLETTEGTLELSVTGFDAAVEPGGTVQVYGTLGPGHTIEATNVVVVNPAGSSATVKYATSAVGAVLVLVVFFGRWRPELSQWAFVPREDSDG